MAALPLAVSDLHRRFFDAALDLLAEEGFGALKQRRLMEHMGLTTGAFFHSFDNWKDFTVRLLEYWHSERTIAVMKVVKGLEDPTVQVEELLLAALHLRHEAEAAIRAWAGSDPEVERVVALVDAERVETVAAAFEAKTGDAALAGKLAHTSLYILIGYEQSRTAHDEDKLEWALRMVQHLATCTLALGSTAADDAERPLGLRHR